MDYTLEGQFTPGKIGAWRFDKRSYAGGPPPRKLGEPPKGMTNELVCSNHKPLSFQIVILCQVGQAAQGREWAVVVTATHLDTQGALWRWPLILCFVHLTKQLAYCGCTCLCLYTIPHTNAVCFPDMVGNLKTCAGRRRGI